MTPAELREAAAVMRRAANGEQVQFRFPDSSVWIKFNCPTADIEWNWERRVFRIAPKPREVWINSYPNAYVGSTAFPSLDSAEQAACRGMKPRLFREVLDEQGGAQ